MLGNIFNPIFKIIKLWYIPLLIGILFIILSIVIFQTPEQTLTALGLLFSLSFILGGIAEIVFSVSNRDILPNWGWILVFGIATVLVGFIIISNKALSVSVLIFYIGFLIFFRGVRNISLAWDIRNHGGSDWGILMFMGVLGILIALLILVNPLIGGLSIVIWIALAFFFNGVFGIMLSLQLRKIHKNAKKILPGYRQRLKDLMKELEDDEE